MNRLDMNKMAERRPDQGVTLLIALVYLSLIGIMASAMLTSVHRWLDQESLHANRVQAQAIAEAGLATALHEISKQSDRSYRGERATAFGGGRFQVIVRRTSSEELTLVATGEILHQGIPIARRSIDVRVDNAGQIIQWGQWSSEEVGHDEADT